jgi:nucleoside-diphosphate-sugar epimerase
MDDESILITGSSGMIGTSLAKRLLNAGYDVTGVDVEPNRWSDAVDERTITTDLLELVRKYHKMSTF